jgi:phosphomevalonate kinase
MTEKQPKLILLFCGKRKSGKDFLTDWLQDFLVKHGQSSTIVKLSGPIKSCYAKNNNLNFDELMGDGKYKEKFRNQCYKAFFFFVIHAPT